MAKQGFKQEHWLDIDDNPAGGVSDGTGFTVSWQNGPLGKPDESDRRQPNGAFVEDVIDAVIGRLQFYQDSQFECIENELAIKLLKSANDVLDSRTKRRVKAGVEGSHEGN